VFHHYTIRIRGTRDKAAEHLAAQKIPHAIYYPIPLHKQEAYLPMTDVSRAMPVTDQATAEVLSLPMHTELDTQQIAHIVNAVREAVR
jgi:dTDP-4-amino-4,6-dideoxygalactose transaminase